MSKHRCRVIPTVLTLVGLLFSQELIAQGLGIGTLTKAATLTRDTCSFGHQYDLRANADGSLSLIRLAPGAHVDVRITQSKVTSGALNYGNEVERAKVDQAILHCIETTLPVMLRSLTPTPPASAATPPARLPCRDPSHGIDHYAREFNVTRESPEMGGGHTQPEWCSTYIAMLRGDYPQGQFAIVSSGEHTNNHCAPFNCPQYVYTCTVHVRADPIFVEKVSDACPTH